MAIKKHKLISEKKLKKLTLIEKVDLGVRLGVAYAQLQHKKDGDPIYVWSKEKNRIVKIPANKIRIPKEFSFLK